MSAYYAGLRAVLQLASSGQVLAYYIMRDGVRMVEYVGNPTTRQVRAFELRCARESMPLSRMVRKDAASVPTHSL